jgi:hypothetical protein
MLSLITRKLINKFFKEAFVAVIYEAKVGIKPVNQLISSDFFELYQGARTSQDTGNLFLSFDGLKDRFSLMGTPITESPHYAFIKALECGNDLHSTEYVERMEAGTLDFRPATRLMKRNINKFQSIFQQKKEEIYSRKIPQEIKALLLNGKYYIADGKHRAALCAMYGLPIMVKDVTPIIYDSYFHWIHNKMQRHPQQYKKHLDFFSLAYGINKGSD